MRMDKKWSSVPRIFCSGFARSKPGLNKSILIIAAAFLVSLGLASGAEAAAPYRYGSMALSSPGEAWLWYRTLDVSEQGYRCQLEPLYCFEVSTSTLQYPVFLRDKKFDLNADGSLAVVKENGRNRLYDVRQDSLSELPINTSIYKALFTADNRKLVVITNARRVLTVDLATNRVSRLLSSALQAGVTFPVLSVDGRYLSYYTSSGRRHHLVDLERDRAYSVSSRSNYWNLLSEETRLFDFSPDGKTLIYLDDRDGHPTLYQVEPAKLSVSSLAGRRIITRPYTVADFLVWESNKVFFIANREEPMEWNLYLYDLATKDLELVAENVSYGNMLRRSGNYLFFGKIGERGVEVAFYRPAEDQLGTLPAGLGYAAAKTEYTPLADANGALVLPPSGKTDTLVVWFHGGPYRQASPGYHSYPSYGGYNWILEGMRARGAAILKLDYPGSYGYGRVYAESLRGNIGKKDIAEVLAGIREAQAKTGATRTYLTGVSYGGYLSLKALVEAPELFTGAISVNGVSNWYDLLVGYPQGIFGVHFGGPPSARNMALYNTASVRQKAGDISNQKVLLMHSEKDTWVPYAQSRNMNQVLIDAGKNVEFVTLAGEDHVFEKGATLENVCRRFFAFTGYAESGYCRLSP